MVRGLHEDGWGACPREGPMRLSRFALAAAVMLFCCGMASADGIDPQILLGGGGDPTAVESMFTVPLSETGGGFFQLLNGSNQVILSLELTMQGNPSLTPGNYNCGIAPETGLTGSCHFVFNEDGTVSVFFTDLATIVNTEDPPGIGIGAAFFLNFGGSGWVANDNVTGVVNPAPEPATFAMFALGAGLLLLMRKRVQAGIPAA